MTPDVSSAQAVIAKSMSEKDLSDNIVSLARMLEMLVHRDPTWRATATDPGYPDLTLVRSDGRVIWAELKREGGKLTHAQHVWVDRLRKYAECYVWTPIQWLNGEIEGVLRGRRAVPMSSEEIAVMRAVHHAYCHDTGCFDGDDISNPKITAALEDYAKMVERRVLAQQPCYWTWTANQLQEAGSQPLGGDCVDSCEPLEPACPPCAAKYGTKPLLVKDGRGFSKIETARAAQTKETSGSQQYEAHDHGTLRHEHFTQGEHDHP